jgi:acetolactate synthase small subunit
MKLIFRIGKAGEHGRSPIEVIIKNGDKIYHKTIDNTDKVLSTLDTLLKSAKLNIESLTSVKIETHKEAGLTSTRIIKSITKALSFSL